MPNRKAEAAENSYDIMDEATKIDAAVRDGADFLKPGISDIAVVLLSTSLIDKILRISLISGFRAGTVSKTMIANVFDGKGPLATFSAKIDVCSGLGNIVPDIRHDLKIINSIRNDFAHSPIELELSNYPTCRSLRVTSGIDVQKEDCIERQMFKRSCSGIISRTSFGILVRIAQHRFLSANSEGVKKEIAAMLAESENSTPTE